MDLARLPLANLARRPGRTALAVALTAVLAFAACGGTLTLMSLRGGLASLEARLGADLIVAPKTANSTHDLAAIVLDGVPGHFYMDAAYVDKVAARAGVERVSPQYFLASAKASCCSVPVQIVGIDPATDFTIQPWIARSYGDALGEGDVITGCNVSGAPGSSIRLYGVDCAIVGRLDETGTSLDNAVFCNAQTIAELIDGSVEQGISVLAETDPADVVSTVQVRVADGTSVASVVDDINLHVRGVTAVATTTMLSGVADSVGGVSGVVGGLVVAVWVLAVVVLAVAFFAAGSRRTLEFATLRLVGASRRQLAGVVVREAAISGAAGGALGAGVAVVAVWSFNALLEAALGLPFLLPSVVNVALVATVTIAVACLCAAAASAASAWRLSHVDPGQTLRGE